MRRAIVALVSSLAVALSAPADAQVPAGTTVCITDLGGAVRTQVLAIDVGGAVAPFGGFAADALAPLAVAVDPIDRHVLVALDLGNGTSRVQRLLPGAGLSFAGEVVLADLPGRCEQLAVAGDDVLAVVDGALGGVYRLPRRGGVAVRTVVLANACAMHWFGFSDAAIVAWSGATTPASSPGLVHVDTRTGQVLLGPFPFPNMVGARPTGLIDLPTALSRQVVAFADGTFWMHVAGSGNPSLLPMTPPPPSGGAAAFHQDGFGMSGLAVGGAALPQLYRADASGVVAPLSALLPGAPVDLAVPLASVPQVLAFGAACGAPQLQLVNGVRGPPQLGNSSFDVRVGGALPQQFVALVVGFDDVLGGLLPASVGNCLLHVSPDQFYFGVSNVGGLAIQPLPIPGQPALAGLIAFAQWAQPVAAGFAASAAMAIQLAP